MTDTEIESTTYIMGSTGMLCTAEGLDVLSEGLLGKEILFTRVALGDGELSAVSEEDYRAKVLGLTEMINWRVDVPIVEKVNQGNGKMLLHAMKDNAEISDSFFAREQAVFAKHPVTGKEILYSYRNSGDQSSFIANNLGPVARVLDVGLITVIQNAKNVNAVIDASFAYTARKDFTEHVDGEHPHPNIPNHFSDVTDATEFWVTYNDSHLHKIKLDNARQVLTGELSKTVESNRSRINELEKIILAKEEVGLDANILIVEDFNPITELDMFSCKVVSCSRGGRLIGVDTVDGIVKGAYYWISDGVNQELVQVGGVAYGVDYYRVTLEVPLTYDYNGAKLYRTTYTDKHADKKTLKWIPRTVFNGIEANLEREIWADTSQSNKTAIKMEGEGMVTSTGYMTLDKNFKGEYTHSDGNPGSEHAQGIDYEHITDEEIAAIWDRAYNTVTGATGE